jgi:hypothetical protein
MSCHAQIWNKSPYLTEVRKAFFADQPIPWVRVHNLPDFVYFNHAIHVSKGVGCYSCHGRVDQMAAIEQRQPLTMGWCLECHRDPKKQLRPLVRRNDDGHSRVGAECPRRVRAGRRHCRGRSVFSTT